MMNARLATFGPPEGHLKLCSNQDVVRDEIAALFTQSAKDCHTETVLLTLLMTDIVGSTSKLAQLGDHRWAKLLDQHDEIVRKTVGEYRGYAINTTGDGFIIAFSVPTNAIKCAQKIRSQVSRLKIAMRMGIHIGECERRGADISGLTVHIAARILCYASRGQVLISGTVRDVTIGSGHDLRHVSAPRLKDVPGDWPLYEVRK